MSINIENYLISLSEERKNIILKLREIINNNIPKGFKEIINNTMIDYVVPLDIYPKGYHCSPKTPLPFLSLASKKNFIALYHMGIYSDEELKLWFTSEYPNHCKRKLDMGKSCIRFKYLNDIPYALISDLISRITVDDWINTYEQSYLK